MGLAEEVEALFFEGFDPELLWGFCVLVEVCSVTFEAFG